MVDSKVITKNTTYLVIALFAHSIAGTLYCNDLQFNFGCIIFLIYYTNIATMDSNKVPIQSEGDEAEAGSGVYGQSGQAK
jgi:hypothetical protein